MLSLPSARSKCTLRLAGSREGYRLYTMDHSTGELRLDLEHQWASDTPPQPILPPRDQRCDSEVKPPAQPQLLRVPLLHS